MNLRLGKRLLILYTIKIITIEVYYVGSREDAPY